MAWQQILQTSADAELDLFFGGIEVNEFRQLQTKDSLGRIMVPALYTNALWIPPVFRQ